jgi:hypothetical protein
MILFVSPLGQLQMSGYDRNCSPGSGESASAIEAQQKNLNRESRMFEPSEFRKIPMRFDAVIA